MQVNKLEAVAVPWQEIFPSLAYEKPSVTLDDFLSDEDQEEK
jgi:hypothetical protein